MLMNRRSFLAITPSIGLVILTAPTLVSLVGCTSSEIADINVVLTEAENILTVVDPTATWVTSFKAAVTALESAETTWESGGSVQLVIDALNTLVAVTADIPTTASYSPLVDVFVAAIEAILAILPSSASVSISSSSFGTTRSTNPHIGKAVIKHRLFRSRADDFRSAWNAIVAANPSLAHAALK